MVLRLLHLNKDYTEAQQATNDVWLTNIQHFNLEETLDCGQAFRYEKMNFGYQGIAFRRRISLMQSDGHLILKDVSLPEFESTWKDYFDLQRDYSSLRSFLVEYGGNPMKLATEFSPGLRHMRQEPWEILISFILSQNTNIPRIKTMIRRLCENFGEKLDCGGYTFPSSKKLASLNPDDLRVIKCGYRAAFIIDAARRTTDGRFSLEDLKHKETAKIREELLKIHGVGPKVADCVLLHGFNKTEVCPVDVWIKRALEKYYPKGLPDKLVPYAGIAQQFLFHYIRK